MYAVVALVRIPLYASSVTGLSSCRRLDVSRTIRREPTSGSGRLNSTGEMTNQGKRNSSAVREGRRLPCIETFEVFDERKEGKKKKMSEQKIAQEMEPK